MYKVSVISVLFALSTCCAAQQYVQSAQPGIQYKLSPQQYRLSTVAQPVQYRQLTQEEYLAAYGQQPHTTPVREEQPEQQVRYVYQQQPSQANVQPILGNVERQIQKAAAQAGGSVYSAAVANAQLAAQQQLAQEQVQRNALRIATAPRAQSQGQPQYQRLHRPTSQQLEEQGELPEQYDPNPSYQFGFDVKDDHYTNYQNRKEQRQGDKITGSYSVVDADGYIRTVTYTADPKEGFKAEVQRQPTDIVVKTPPPPTVKPNYQQVPQQIQYRQPQTQYVEVPAQAQASNSDDKQRYIYQYQ